MFETMSSMDTAEGLAKVRDTVPGKVFNKG